MISHSTLEMADGPLLQMKQTVIQFQTARAKKFAHNHRQLSTIGFHNPEHTLNQQPYQDTYSALKPKLASKKLLDEPKFFISLERRKNKILDGLKKVGDLSSSPQMNRRGSTKRNNRSHSTHKKSMSFLEDHELYSQANRLGWQPNTKTPFLNFNMQYLIRKRKSMTPSLQRKGDRFIQAIHSRGCLN